MLDKFFKKEKPFLGLAGFGGGGTGLAISSQAGYDGITASGGVISDYESGGSYYRAHIFTGSGALVVTELGSYGGTAEYLVVAGGGSGGYEGGGGAGGVRTNLSGHPLSTNNPSLTLTAGETYPITVGAGGARAVAGPAGVPVSGNNSAILTPSTAIVTATGGGGAGNYPGVNGRFGGSGGGSSTTPSSGGFGMNPTTPGPQGGPYPHTEGFPGAGYTGTPYAGSGGGGAGGSGHGPGDSPGGGGGEGVKVLIAGPDSYEGIGYAGPSGNGQWYGGGGAGGASPSALLSGGGMGPYAAPYAGGGHGAQAGNTTTGIAPAPANATPGAFLSGGGGGGVWNGATGVTGAGGPGIVIIRYQINTASTAKATGGTVYYTDTKTIHVFNTPGTFATTASWSAPTSVEYVMVGGGGSGACAYGGGGGAGQFLTGTQTVNAHPVSTTIAIGAGGIADNNQPGYARQGVDGTATTWSQGSLSAAGGGGGGSGGAGPNAGRAGGSGGGGAVYPASGGAASPGPGGNPGGTGAGSPYYGCGGGGGAGGAGSDGTSGGSGGAGGDGINVPATFQTPLINLNGGPSTHQWKVAAGGGGGFYVSGTGGAGGAGGGGTGAGSPLASSPSVIHAYNGTGSGGGGASDNNSPPENASGFGGSGIVLLAYPT